MNKWSKGLFNLIMGMVFILVVLECQKIDTLLSYVVEIVFILVCGLIFYDVNKGEKK